MDTNGSSPDDAATLRARLVAELVAASALSDGRVADAFRRVPRERFLPGTPLDQVYRDSAITIKAEGGIPVSSSSQPSIMAIMLEQLALRPGQRVLEIGAGTGYNAALLQELVGPAGSVVTVDIDGEVAAWARDRLDAAGYQRVAVHAADGSAGWLPGAPYDRIIATVGSADLAPAWVDQLRPGGMLVLPLWINTAQVSVAFEQSGGAARLISRSIRPCGFTRIRGALAGPDQYYSLGPGLTLAYASAQDDAVRLTGQLRDLINRGCRRESLPNLPGFDFYVWLAWRAPSMVALFSRDDRAGFVGAAVGLFDQTDGSLGLLPLGDEDDATTTCLRYGGTRAGARFRAAIEAWRAADSPRLAESQIVVYPLSSAPAMAPGEAAVETHWWRLVLSSNRQAV